MTDEVEEQLAPSPAENLNQEAFPRSSCPGPLACFNRFRLQSDDATGWIYHAAGSNPAVMSNVFLGTAFLFLAKRQAGCEDDDEVECGKVYGMKPSSLISIIGTVSGLLCAFFLPFIGAIIDYTDKRWECGVCAAALFVLIQAIQIGTVERTWFAMAILQAFNGFFFQIMDVCKFAYLPEIGAVTERKTFTWYNSLFSIVAFSHSLLFLITVVGIGILLSLDDKRIGQLGQAIDMFVTGGYYYISYHFFQRRGPRNTLEEGEQLYCAGFKQVLRTTKQIFKHYPRSIGMFFLGTAFSDSGMTAFTALSVTYLNVVLEFDGSQIGILYVIVLFFMIPGAYFAYWFAAKTTPLTAMKFHHVIFIAYNFGAFFWLTDPSMEIEAYVLGIFWGLCLGMYYPLNKMIFSLIIPAGQEAELSGFWKYCTEILSWAPPLVFTLMNESGISLSLGAASMNFFLIVGLVLYMVMPPWDECLKEAGMDKMKENAPEQT